LSGGSGDDRLHGGSGDDKLYGGSGDDVLHGGSGDDVLKGGTGDDKLYGGSGDDVLHGGSGDDVLHGGSGDDRLHGGSGDDVLKGGTGDDKLYGGSGDDKLHGGSGDDVLSGGSGDDVLHGGSGDDKLYGGSGDDVLSGGSGDDVLKGGSGDDIFIYNSGDGSDTVVGGDGKDTLHLGDTTLTKFAAEWEITDAAGNAVDVSELIKDGKLDLSSLNGAGTITAPDGNEIDFKSLESVSFAEGGPSDDILLAGKGDDTLIGGQGDDFLKGGQGDDSFIYNTGDGSDVVFGGQGNDNLHFGDVTIEEFSQSWQVLDSDGNEVDLKEITVDGQIDLSSIDGNGTVVGPDGSEITVKSLETLSFEEAEIVPPTTSPSPIDGLVHDGKITVTLGGESFKGDPAYAIVVDGKEVARGEVDWAKDTEGAEKLYGNEGKNDVDNSQVKWKDISFDYDFSDGMPQKVEVRFLNDACGGHDPKSGEWQDRNLIVDKIKVDGLSVESEGDFTKYANREGMERMPWQGSLEFNMDQAYSSHMENYQAAEVPGTPPTSVPGDAPDFTPPPPPSSGPTEDMLRGVHVEDPTGGSPAEDVLIRGTQGSDVIEAGQGNDQVYSGSGDDVIKGGAGSDILHGDRGDDLIKGGSGNDKLAGGPGDDTLKGGQGNDVLHGESGDDVLKGGKGDDKLAGGSGDDTLKGGQGNDVLHGQSGDDVLVGGQGADVLKGGDGDDVLIGDSAPEQKETGVPIGENLIVNGSFENHGDLNRGSWGTFDSVEGWQTSEGNIEIQKGTHGGTPGAADGDSVLELDAHEGRDTNASVYQDIRTGSEGTFKLSFSFSAREIGDAANTAASNTTEVYWGTEKVATISADQKGWETHDFELPVNPDGGDTTRLEFRGTGTDDGIGGLIDNVSVMRIA
jgi:Ca2+-binding RTX toxin-like protein